MELKKYTWNNGTKNNPIVLTIDQIKKLIVIGQREDIENDVRGWITTSSRKMQKFFKYTLEHLFPNLNIICDEELPDTFIISTSSNIIKEGTKETIKIDTDSSITHEFLKWKYDFTEFNIEGDISEQNIKDRIRVENGQLVIDDPQENASWSTTLKLTAYPFYVSDDELSSLPITSKPYIILTIIANKIEDITLSVKEEIPVKSKVEIKVTPVPENSTKLKGAKYTYSTNTPEIIAINTSSLGTEIIAKKQGDGNVIVTLHACNNTVTKTNSISFMVYDLRPVCFVIDQRYKNNLSDPDSMVSENCILNENGTLQSISSNGAQGSPSNNTLSWIRKNTHAYVSKNIGFSGIRLKQLDDNNRKKFADGSSAIDYISNTNGEYDVFIKFSSDIYYKTEPYTPEGESSPNEDYILVTIAKELPEGENKSTWNKWSQYKLIGVYEACEINNKLYSLSGQIPVNKISQKDSITKAKARGKNFNICDYNTHALFALLFYGYYSSLNCQKICGYGTYNYANGLFYPKRTGITDELAMTDTTNITGNGTNSPNIEQIKAGYGDNIKSVNFWGLENFWGDLNEWLYNISVMEAFRSNTSTNTNPTNYVADYLDINDSIIITKQNGIDTIYTSKEDFLIDYTVASHKFLSITDKNNNIIHIIDMAFTNTNSGYAKKMIFGSHADIIPKDFVNKASADTGFCDHIGVQNVGFIACRSHESNDSRGGISCLNVWYSDSNTNETRSGARLLYDGDETMVHVVDNTESL